MEGAWTSGHHNDYTSLISFHRFSHNPPQTDAESTMKVLLAAVLGLVTATGVALAATSPEPQLSELPSTDRLPGIDLAEGISQITGVAISPMLGVCSVGAWRYYHTPEQTRCLLPWFCHPRVWGIGFVVLTLCFLKDSLGTVAPPLLKKPMDMAELFESKFSAAIASTAFVPFVAAQMAQHLSSGHPPLSGALSATQRASLLPVQLGVFPAGVDWLVLPLCIIAFLVVWLTAHGINVLIAICPFGFIDAVLKLIKTFLLSSIVLSYIINPYLGAAVSIVIIFVAALVAPSAFRLAVFGTWLALDTIFPGRAKRRVRPDRAHAFLMQRLPGVPVRTLGWLYRNHDGSVTFCFRPFFIFARRSIAIPTGEIALSKGLFFPTLIHSVDGATFSSIIAFPPRYRGHEEAMGDHLGIGNVRDGGIIKGFRAIRAWIIESISLGKARFVELERSLESE